MKNIIIFAIAIFITITASAQSDKFTVTVEGMGCPFCAYGLEKKFKEMDGVKSIKIDIETGVMTFMSDASKNLNTEKVTSQVDKAGYTAKEVKIERANGKVEMSAETKTAISKESVTTETFQVSGNCGMCEARIEKAAQSIDGVTSADWSTESKMITVRFDANKVSLNDVHNKIAAVGHDTGKLKAKTDVYEKLPGCCLYDREGGK